MGVTDLVRQALAELGPDASLRQVGDYVLAKDPTVPRSYISLALRNLKKKRPAFGDDPTECAAPAPLWEQ